MKFQLVIEPDGKKLILLPETDGERAILATIAPGQSDISASPARVSSEWEGRSPYTKLIKVRIIFGEVHHDE